MERLNAAFTKISEWAKANPLAAVGLGALAVGLFVGAVLF